MTEAVACRQALHAHVRWSTPQSRFLGAQRTESTQGATKRCCAPLEILEGRGGPSSMTRGSCPEGRLTLWGSCPTPRLPTRRQGFLEGPLTRRCPQYVGTTSRLGPRSAPCPGGQRPSETQDAWRRKSSLCSSFASLAKGGKDQQHVRHRNGLVPVHVVFTGFQTAEAGEECQDVCD